MHMKTNNTNHNRDRLIRDDSTGDGRQLLIPDGWPAAVTWRSLSLMKAHHLTQPFT